MDNDEFYCVDVRGENVDHYGLTYAEAVEVLNTICDEWENDGYTVDRSWASSGNYSAAKGVKVLNRDRFVGIERDES